MGIPRYNTGFQITITFEDGYAISFGCMKASVIKRLSTRHGQVIETRLHSYNGRVIKTNLQSSNESEEKDEPNPQVD